MSPSHYFDNNQAVASAPRRVEVNLPDLTVDLGTDRGVFSADQLDAGTKLLLLEAPPPADTDLSILDLGCGWGPIACVTALRAPRSCIWAVDVNERARALTAANAESIGAGDRVRVGAPDDVPIDVRFDRILSNPPIRIGKAPLHQMLLMWLARLTPTGVAHLVVQRHLGSDSLAEWLGREGYPAKRLISRAGYRLLEVGAADPGAGQ